MKHGDLDLNLKAFICNGKPFNFLTSILNILYLCVDEAIKLTLGLEVKVGCLNGMTAGYCNWIKERGSFVRAS